MLVRDFECRSYDDAIKTLNGVNRRTVCNNTVLRAGNGGDIEVELHGHCIVQFRPDRSIVLWSRVHQTATTKDRINRCLPRPMLLFQRSRTWYLREYNMRPEILFAEGMVINKD